ncbi:unnamed protein product, partial [Closterium sp. NIES-54]
MFEGSPGLFEVASIAAHRDTPHGREFLVHWKDQPASEDSWEPESHLDRAATAVNRHDTPDLSPPRKGKKGSPDLSPPRRIRNDSPDLSPPRARHDLPDLSPPCKNRKDPQASPDLSPLRRQARQATPDLSPPRRRARQDSPDLSPPRRRARQDSSDLSPPRKGSGKQARGAGQGGGGMWKGGGGKVERMMDGSLAGLRSGKEVMAEAEEKRANDEAKFAQLDPSVSGRGAQTVYRDKAGACGRAVKGEVVAG